MNEQRARARIEAAVQQVVASGTETGVQVAVIKNGQVIVDAVAGTADPATGAAVSGGTLFYAASTAKGVASSVAHVLAERGELRYDLRAADVWPEFAARGKYAVTLRHVLLHTAGVPGLPADTTVADLCDWDRMCAVLADEEPWWEPGTRFGYHAKTFGFLLGEILRRATGRTISTLLRESSPAHWVSRTRSASGCHHGCWLGWPARSRPKASRRPHRNQDRRSPGRCPAECCQTPVTPTAATC